MNDPILIVGAGPTGLTAALELSRAGLPVRLVDRQPEPPTTSRAIGIQARTLELLHQRGLAEEMVRLGNPAAGGRVYGGGGELFRLDFGRVASRFNFLLFLSQAETERILRAAVGRQGVEVERGVEVVALGQDAHSREPAPVAATLRHPGGRLELARSPWLIAAEGAHSVVRATLDLPFEGKTRTEHYALGDLFIDGELADSDFHIFSSEHGFMGLFPMGRRHFRLIASNPIGDPGRGEPPTLEELQTIYDGRSGVPARFRDLSWSSWFRINSRMVSRLRVGRLLLGGDSAHIHSPAGAQGMNTGIQDMINLGWKLARVVRDGAPAALLDTYEQERLPVMRDVLANTEGLTGLIGSENPIVRGLVDHLGPFVGGAGFVQERGTARMTQLAIHYRGGPLAEQHGHPGLHAGDRTPDVRVRLASADPARAVSLLDLLDPDRFVLLAVNVAPSTPPAPGLREAAAAWGDRLTLVEVLPPDDPAAADAYGEAIGRGPGTFLIRPDGYVGLACGHGFEASWLDEYRRKWLGPAESARDRP